MAQDLEGNERTLAIDPETVCYIIVKAREFDVKVDPVETDPGSNAADDGETAILQDYANDPTYDELKSAIESLNEEQQYTLVALMWLGRGTYGVDEWETALDDARAAANDRTAEYLLGTPLLADYLEEGLSQFGFSCEDIEMGRL